MSSYIYIEHCTKLAKYFPATVYNRGLKIIREGSDYYLIHQGEIQRYLGGSGKPKNDSKGEEKQKQPSEIAESILFFIGDLESACACAKRACM